MGLDEGSIDKAIAPCGHLGLFMGEKTLTDMWRKVADWLRSEKRFQSPGQSPPSAASTPS